MEAVDGGSRMDLAAQPAHRRDLADADPGDDGGASGRDVDAAGAAALIREGEGGGDVRLGGQRCGARGTAYACDRGALPVRDREPKNGGVASDFKEVRGDGTTVACCDVWFQCGGQMPGEFIGMGAFQSFHVAGLFETRVKGVGQDRQRQQQCKQRGELLTEGMQPKTVCHVVEQSAHSSSSL